MNPRSNFRVLGAMSGTSLDGLDLVLVRFEQNEKWLFQIERGTTIAYSDEWKGKLKEAPTLSGLELKKLDLDFARFCGQQMNDFLGDETVDFIASHGHTIFHDPEVGLTHQMGDASTIAAVTGFDVLADFRSKDVALGGQGAPLVPIGDELLFSDFDACVNLGGFANVSMRRNEKRVAWDVCPANIVLNELVAAIGLSYDNNGNLASEGSVLPEILNKLEELSFYASPAPKSLGREWVESHVFPCLDGEMELKDVLATFAEHIAMRIAEDLNNVKGDVLFTGGGVYNEYLMKRINDLGAFNTVQPKRELVEYKEAVVFAFLGVLWMCGISNSLSDVTGAKHDHISGVLVKGKQMKTPE